jgi:hypothetical protein
LRGGGSLARWFIGEVVGNTVRNYIFSYEYIKEAVDILTYDLEKLFSEKVGVMGFPRSLKIICSKLLDVGSGSKMDQTISAKAVKSTIHIRK